MKARLTAAQIWRAPVVLGAVSAVGISAALLSESVGDVLSWVALGMPGAVVIWFSCRRRRH